jgi:predicted CXXCH cytochrome family protein
MNLTAATGLADHENAEHGKCHTCHTQNNPENDLRSCRDCHPGYAPADPNTALSREEAVHKKCMECHNWAYPARTAKMPLLCTDCHKPEPSLIEEPGPVLFSHRRHAEYGDMTCDVCHHTDVPGEPHMACTRCHGADLFTGIPSAGEALHIRCLGCHKDEEVGLTKWEHLKGESSEMWYFRYQGEDGSFWWNHGFHAVDMAFSCRDCHHNITKKDGQYVTAVKLGDAWAEADAGIQSCANCHKPGGKAPKGLTEAYKKACITCHERLGAGPVTWEAFFKSQ